MTTRNNSILGSAGKRIVSLLLWVPLFMTVALGAASAATLNNTAHATGTGPGAVTVDSATDLVALPVTIKDPNYTVNKSVANGTVTNGSSNATVDAAGDSFVYSIAVANTGNVTLSDPVLTDPGPLFGGVARTGTYTVPTVPTSGDDGDGVFEVGENWVYSITYVVTQTDINNAAAGAGAVTNTVSIAVTDPQGIAAPIDPVATSDPTADTTIATTSSMTVDKTATVSTDGGTTFAAMTVGQTLNAGDIVRYSYLVTNTGNTTLTNITIAEDTFNGTGGTAAIVIPGTIASLAPAGTGTLVANNYTVTQADIDNLQ